MIADKNLKDTRPSTVPGSITHITPIKKDWPFVMLGVPCGDRVHSPFAQTLWGLGRRYPGKQGVIMGHSSIVVNGRNQVIDGCQQWTDPKVEYVMFLDSDMTFPSDTVQRLLAHEKDIVGATYRRRGPPYDVLGHVDPTNHGATLAKMDHIPTGCLLIRMSVFDAFKRPYFRLEVDESAEITHGEDYIFSRDAIAKGFDVWCDNELSKDIGHLVQYELKIDSPIAEEKAVANG